MFLRRAYHIDEPYYLAIARQILRDPLHPFAFSYNWYGAALPVAAMQIHSAAWPYLLALPLKWSGGEALVRLAFLPLDMVAAASLYLLAARYLKRPLAPVLAAAASPAYFLCMQTLMPEKMLTALGLFALYALVRGEEENRGDWRMASALAIGAALLFKYSAAYLVATAAAYLWLRRAPPRRIAGFLALAVAPALLDAAVLETHRVFALGNFLAGIFSARNVLAVHRLRSLSAFVGGCGAVAAWPYLAQEPGRGRRLRLGLSLAGGTLLFAPFLDRAGLAVRPLDRTLGATLSTLAFYAVSLLLEPRRGAARGRELWTAWTLSALGFAAVYPIVAARFVLPVVPALVLGLASRWECRPAAADVRARPWLGVASTLALSLALSAVDARYADAQRAFARGPVAAEIARGRKVWFTGHWGLQYYMEEAGAAALDAGTGGWKAARPGDMVVVTRVNADRLLPSERMIARVRRLDDAVPLRLMSDGTTQAGFYSNDWGFLPFAISRAPLDEFAWFEIPRRPRPR